MLSMLYEEKMDYKSGIEVLEKAKVLSPENVDLLYQIGILYEKNGDTERALQHMEDVLSIDPEYANALNFIGYTWAEKGINLDKAEEMIKKALMKRPDDGYIIDSIGWVYYKKGDYVNALTEILRAHQSLPDDPTIAEHLGDVYVSLKEYDKAIDYFEKSIKLEKKEDKKKILEMKIKSLEEKKR
jgi:tetratricopeptide (TPR) repeat protein